MRLVYTEDAIAELQRLREVIAIHNPSAASRVANELIGKIELLPGFPEMGAPVEMAPVSSSIRDMIFGRYVVRYSIHASTLIILRVWHELEGER